MTCHKSSKAREDYAERLGCDLGAGNDAALQYKRRSFKEKKKV